MNQRKSRIKKNRNTQKQRCMQKNKPISLMYVVHNLMKLNKFVETNYRLIQKGEKPEE